jgi:hypothetical protein
VEKEMILLNKKYEGFEDFYDYFRDVSEICEFPEDSAFKNVKGEFQGTIQVVVKFIPAEGDL